MRSSGRLCEGTVRGRAQIICVYWVISAGTISIQYAFGAIYVELLDQLDGSLPETALIGSLCVALEEGCGAFVGVLSQRFGERRCALAGSLLVGLGFFTSAAVGEVWQLLLTYSVLVGLGCSLALYSTVMCVNRWFDSGLAKAHAFAKTGASVGPLVLGGAAPALFGAVGWRGALLVLGGVDCVCLLLAASMLRSPPGPPPGAIEADRKRRATDLPPHMRELDVDRVLADDEGVGAFLEFARGEWSAENLEFWLQAEAFARRWDAAQDAASRQADAARLVDEFLRDCSPRQVCVGDARVRPLVDGSAQTARDMFAVVQEVAHASMRLDIFPRFEDSPRGAQLKLDRRDLCVPLKEGARHDAYTSEQSEESPASSRPSEDVVSAQATVTNDSFVFAPRPSKVDPESSRLSALLPMPRFWAMCVVTFAFGFGGWINVVHLVRVGEEEGLGDEESSRLLTMLGVGSLTMRVPSGILADYFGRGRTLACLLALFVVQDGLCAWDVARSSEGFLLFQGFMVGWLTGGILSILPAWSAELLPRHVARLAAAAIMTPFGAGLAIGPTVAAATRSASGRYDWAFASAAVSLGVAGLIAAVLGWKHGGACSRWVEAAPSTKTAVVASRQKTPHGSRAPAETSDPNIALSASSTV